MSEEQIQQFMQEFQQMSPEEQQQVLQYIQQELQGGQQEGAEMPQQEMQEAPQEMMMAGGMHLQRPQYYQSGGFLIPAQTGMTAQGAQIIPLNPVNGMMNGMQLQADSLAYAQPVQEVKKPAAPKLVESKKELRKAETIFERGQAVKQVQAMLVEEGFDIGKNSKGQPDIDGLLGNKTAAALEMYRKSKGLSTTDWKSTFKELTGNAPVAAKVVSTAPVQQDKVNEIVVKAAEKPLPDDYYTNYKTGYVARLKEDYEASLRAPNDDTPFPAYLKNKRNSLQRPKSVVAESTGVRSGYGQELGEMYNAKPGTIRRGYSATDQYDGVTNPYKGSTIENKEVIGTKVGDILGRKGLFSDPVYFDYTIVENNADHYIAVDPSSKKKYKIKK